MLTIQKSITLTGISKITVDAKEVIAVSMSANIKESGNSNIVTTILNQEVYEANKDDCRTDIDAFTAEVRAIEDSEE